LELASETREGQRSSEGSKTQGGPRQARTDDPRIKRSLEGEEEET
jgi:hypothetical protein